MSLDIDFENFSVEADRKAQVRTFIEALKVETWVADLKHLVTELGSDRVSASEDGSQLLPGMLEETKAQIFRTPENHPAHGIEVLIQAHEMKIFFNRKPWVELTILPKGNEYAVFFVDETSFEDFKVKMTELADLIKESRGKKSSRQAEWKARFSS